MIGSTKEVEVGDDVVTTPCKIYGGDGNRTNSRKTLIGTNFQSTALGGDAEFQFIGRDQRHAFYRCGQTELIHFVASG